MKSAPWILGDIQMQFGRNGRSLFYFYTGEGIYLLPAEDEDLAVMKTGTYFDEANEWI